MKARRLSLKASADAARRVLRLNRSRLVRDAIDCLLIVVIVILGYKLKQALRFPTPLKWNYYTAEANAHLYEGPDVVSPQPTAVVAHAGGEFHGMTYTNSLEALDFHYDRGHRLFELDFSWTSDRQLAAIHDWDNFPGPSGRKGQPPTLAEFIAHPSQSTTPTTILMVYRWIEEHPGAFVVTDITRRDMEGLAKIRMERPELVHRFIPQIYRLRDYDLAVSQGFKNIILTLYRCSSTPDDKIVQFAREHRLFALTMSLKRCRNSDLAARLRQLNVPVYVHTVNDAATVREVLKRGAHGVYSDSLCPADLALIQKNGTSAPLLR